MKSINLVYLEYKYVEKQHLSFYFIGEVQTCHAISIYNRITFYLSQEELVLSNKNTLILCVSNGKTTLFYFDFYIFISGMISIIYCITMVFEQTL